jgi:hypothetical protein
MSTIPTPASISEALDLIENGIGYWETAEFKALPVETRIEYFNEIATIARVLQARALTEYIRRRWDGTVRRAYERPMTGSMKVSWSGVRTVRKS